MSRTSAVASLVLIATTVALTGCSAAGAGEDFSDSASVAISTDPSTFDPALSRAQDDYVTARLLFDTVLRKDADNELVGGLAQSWEAIDASHYSLMVRDDASCADGTPITATVVADSLARFASPETASTGRTLTLGGASATFTADDELGTIDIELSAGWSDFLTGLTLPQAGIVCPAGLADPEGLAAGTVEGAFSGPYTLTASQAAVSYTVTLREDYDTWPEFAEPLTGDAPAVMVLTPLAENATVATQLLSGALDFGVLTDESVNRFDDSDDFSMQTTSNNTTYLMFNERPGTTFADQPELREAVAQAINAETFGDITTDGRGEVITSVGSANVACVNTDTGLLVATDEDAAAQALAGVSIHIVGTTLLGTGNEYIAEVLRNAGADVTLDSLDNANWSTVTSAGGSDWDINVQGDNNLMGTVTSSLLRVMGPATEDGGRNKMGVVNDEGYAFLQAGLASVEPDEKCEALQSAQASFLDRVDAIPLATLPSVTVVRDGFSVRAFGDYLDLATLRIE